MADPLKSLRRHAIVGLGAIALFLGLLGGWAGTTEIAGAVVAQGTVVPLEGSKRVQHPEGGVVSAILVKDGDAVAPGNCCCVSTAPRCPPISRSSSRSSAPHLPSKPASPPRASVTTS